MFPSSRATLHRQDQLRLSFRPEKVRILFIGESRPASGKFFYQADSGLYRAMRNVFQSTHPSTTDAAFLRTFEALGCYLVDLCGRPVDKMRPQARRAACLAAEPQLCRIFAELQPEMAAVVVRSIQHNVRRAASCAGWTGHILELPYPGRWLSHREVFTAHLIPVLRDLQPMPKIDVEGIGAAQDGSVGATKA